MGLSKLCRNLRKSIEQKNAKFFACETLQVAIFPFFLPSIFDKYYLVFNSLHANPTKWSNTVKQFVGNSQQIL